jgi:hypothetical protein
MLGINSGHHYLPTNKILMISDNVELLLPIFVIWQPGTFTRLRSCIVPAEITEPPKLAVVKTTSTMADRLEGCQLCSGPSFTQG